MEKHVKDKSTSADLSQKDEGGSMRNRDDKGMTNVDRSEIKESNRQPGSSYDSSTGKSSGSGRLRDEHITRDDLENRGKSGSMGTPPKDKDNY